MNVKSAINKPGIIPYLRQFSVLNDTLFFSIDLHGNCLRISDEENQVEKVIFSNERKTNIYELEEPGVNRIDLPISELSKGLYFLKIETSDYSYERKVFLE